MFTLLVFCRRCFRAAVLGLVFIRFSHTVLPLNTFRTRSRFHSNWNVPLPSHCIVANVERMRTRKKRRRNVCPIDGLTAEHDERRVERQTNRMNDRLTDEPNERQTDRRRDCRRDSETFRLSVVNKQRERERGAWLWVSKWDEWSQCVRVCVYVCIAPSPARLLTRRAYDAVCVCVYASTWLFGCVGAYFVCLQFCVVFCCCLCRDCCCCYCYCCCCSLIYFFQFGLCFFIVFDCFKLRFVCQKRRRSGGFVNIVVAPRTLSHMTFIPVMPAPCWCCCCCILCAYEHL